MVGRQIKDYKYFPEERGENEMNRKEKPRQRIRGSTNRGHQPTTGGQDSARLRSSDLTKEADFWQLESLESGPIVDRIEFRSDNQQGAVVGISNAFVVLGWIVGGAEFFSDDGFWVDIHMI